MPITNHELGRRRAASAVRLLFAVNFAFAVLVLLAWQFALAAVLRPMNWASDQPIPSSIDILQAFQYPLVLYWATPAVAMATAWIMLQSHRYRAAFGFLALPIVVMTLTYLMYWTVQQSAR